MLTILQFEDDWAAVYRDGQRIYEGHTSDVLRTALAFAGVTVVSASAVQEEATINSGSAPERL